MMQVEDGQQVDLNELKKCQISQRDSLKTIQKTFIEKFKEQDSFLKDVKLEIDYGKMEPVARKKDYAASFYDESSLKIDSNKLTKKQAND